MKLRRHIVLPLLLIIYITLMAVIFLPRNEIIPTSEKVIILLISYSFAIVLYFVLRKRAK